MRKIRCPKCYSFLSAVGGHPDFRKETYCHYTIECSFCGYMKFMPSENDVGLFVALHTEEEKPIDNWTKNVRLLENSMADLRSKLRKINPLPKPVQKETPPPKVFNTSNGSVNGTSNGSVKLPTPAQRRRGSIHPVNCSICGETTFRRKKELKVRKVIYCSLGCKKGGTTFRKDQKGQFVSKSRLPKRNSVR